jgi:adenylate kinase family enzyme
MKNVIVLIGAPATGKSTLASKLAKEQNCKVFSFDDLFPLESLKKQTSKEARAQMIQMVEKCQFDWIVVDDTNHLHSMQKRYLRLSAAKVLHVHLDADISQIEELFERNLHRGASVVNEEIQSIVQWLSDEPPINRNMLSFSFKSVPDDVCARIVAAFEEIETVLPKTDFISDPSSASHELNNRLNACIHQAFKAHRQLDGKAISDAKREYLASLGHISFEEINELTIQFCQRNLSNKPCLN